MSTKGQIVLPSDIREGLGLCSGSKIAVFSEDGLIMLKPLVLPSEDVFKAELGKAQAWAKQVELSECEIDETIKEVRVL